MRYRAFRTKKDNQFYFQFLNDDGDVLLKSQAYQDKNACFNGIKSVMSNASDPARYEKGTDENGKHYFILKAGNGQEIGRSIDYDTAADTDAAMTTFQTEAPNASSKTKDDSEESTTPAAAAPAPEKTADSGDDQVDKDYSGSKKGTDDYRPLAFYESRIAGTEDGFDTFHDEEGDEHYFTYNLDGLVIMISEGYSSDKSRDNGVASVTKNMKIAERYQRKHHENGKHFFNLRAGNNQEIATSRWFDSGDYMETAIAQLMGDGKGGGQIVNFLSTPMGDNSGDALYKDYKPLAFYQEKIEGVEFGYDPFEDGEDHYFTVNYEGSPVLISEDYTSSAGRDNGIKSVKKNVKNEERYVREQHPNGSYYFNLIAGNKQEIATSRWFESKKDMEKAIRWLQGTGGTRKRKKAKREKKAPAERFYVKQGIAYPCSSITYDSFKSGGNDKYYFVFKGSNDKAILINGDVRGYSSEEDLANAIDEVFKYAPFQKNYERKETKNGKYYFYVKNDDGKNVARSSLFYAEKEAMEQGISILACGAMTKIAAAAPATKKAVVDDYMACEAYTGADGFHSFKNDENGEWYFAYNNSDGTTFLRSEGYTTEAARNNGIASVQKNAPLPERWVTGDVLNGKYHYYALKAGNHQEIARSCYYDSENERDSAMAWVTTAFAPAPVAAAEPPKPKAIVDDYLPCEAYNGAEGFHKFYNEEKKEYYFAYNNSDGETLLRSEGYTTEKARDNGIESVIKNAPLEERWSTDTALNGKYHFYILKAGNHQEIGRSCYYEDKAAMLAALAGIQGENSNIGLGSLGLMSAAMLRSKKEEEDAAAAAAALALKKKEEEEAAAAAAALALKKKQEEEAAAAALALKKKEEEDAAAAAAAAAAALALKKKQEEEAAAAALALREKEEKEKAAAAAALAAAAASKKKEEEAAALAAATVTTEERDNSGCLKWLIPLLLLALLIAALLYFLRGCDGCSTPKTPPVVPIDTVQTKIDTIIPAKPMGPDCSALSFTEGTPVCDMANFLSDAESSFPSTFTLGEVGFARNSARLNGAGKGELDNLIALLNAYPDASIDIYGHVGDNERSAYRGSKELTLDDVRARNIYNYLKSKGIDESRMNFSGNGSRNPNNAQIVLRGR